MDNQYVEWRENGYWIRETRISLDSIVYAFLNGISPETIAYECFTSLTLEQVYGAIAYYLGHRSQIDAYLKQGEAEFEALRQIARTTNPALTQKLIQARRQPIMTGV